MDRRIEVETLRTGLDDVLASARSDTRVVIQQDGQDMSGLARVGPPDRELADPAHIFDRIWADVEARGLPPMSMEEIDQEIEAYRREVREANASRP